MNMPSEPLVLAPDRRVVGTWLSASALATIIALGSVLAAPRTFFGWSLAMLCLVVTAATAALFVAPGRFQVRLDDEGIDVALPWQAERIPWERIHLARVARLLGEDVLECWVAATADDVRASRTTAIYVPTGSDTTALHERLEHHLGRADPADVQAAFSH